MKVICINKSNIIDHPVVSILTVGKVYDVVSEDVGCYFIVDNSGTTRPYNKSRFKSYEQEMRDRMLKELGI